MDVVFALDWDSEARQTFELNFPAATFEPTDIRDTSEDIVYELVAKQRPNPILFCGCAPCQPFTKHNTIRPERDEDDRVPLLLDFLRFIRRCEPDIVFVENVPGIQNVCPDSEPLSQFLKGLAEAGYTEPTFASVPLMRYGVPQGRRRFLLLASRHGPLELPPETHGPGTDNPDYDTVRDWIGDLPEIDAGDTHPTIPDHRAAGLAAPNLKRIRATKEGGGNRDWPDELRLKCHGDATGYSDVYGRMSWDRPASGLTTRCISYSNGRFGHPEQDRAISVREAACLQTFPLDFQFAGSVGFHGPADRQRCAGEAGQGCRTPHCQAPGPGRRDVTIEATFKARARTLDMLGRQQIAGIPTAISELFKNAHDAYADRVEVDCNHVTGLTTSATGDCRSGPPPSQASP